MAEEVMRMPDSQAQAAGGCRTAACSQVREEEGGELIQTKTLNGSSDLALQRQPEVEEEERLQTKQSAGHAPEVTPHLSAEIASMQGDRQPLPAAERAFFEPRFGHDFSQVRIHTGSKTARALHAKAYTIGRDIVVAKDHLKPGTSAERQLLAHELAHVIQQGHAPKSVHPLNSGFDRTMHKESLTPALNSSLRVQRLSWEGARDWWQDKEPDPVCGEAPYAAGVKTVSVDLVKVRGSDHSVNSDLAVANEIFRQCCVQFTKGEDKFVRDDKADEWLGVDDTDLHRDPTPCSTAGSEEKALFDGATKLYNLSSRTRAFYVATFSGNLADLLAMSFAPPSCGGPYVGYILVRNVAPDLGLTHELGHILLEEAGVHSDQAYNLMARPPNMGRVINSEQRLKIYSNA